MEYTFMTVKELAEYLKAHPNKEVGFTDDTREDLEYNDGQPTGWHGAAIVYNFDNYSLICGYYGSGIEFCYNVYVDVSLLVKGLLEYLKDYMFVTRPTKDTEICISKEDLE